MRTLEEVWSPEDDGIVDETAATHLDPEEAEAALEREAAARQLAESRAETEEAARRTAEARVAELEALPGLRRG